MVRYFSARSTVVRRVEGPFGQADQRVGPGRFRRIVAVRVVLVGAVVVPEAVEFGLEALFDPVAAQGREPPTQAVAARCPVNDTAASGGSSVASSVALR